MNGIWLFEKNSKTDEPSAVWTKGERKEIERPGYEVGVELLPPVSQEQKGL